MFVTIAEDSPIVTYRCSDDTCQAEDSARVEEKIQALDCWKCKAGVKKDLGEMLARGIGMFPVASFEEPAN